MRRSERIDLCSPATGSSRWLTVHRYGPTDAGPKAYLHAGLHADEWPGLMALHHLIPMLDAAAERGDILGEIVVLPYANPIGLSQRLGGHTTGRYSFDGSGNFNRSWADLAALAAPRLEGRLSGEAHADKAKVRQALREAAADLPRRTEIQSWRAEIAALSCDADYVLDLHCDGKALIHIYANQRHADIATELALDLDAAVLLLEENAGGGAFDEAAASPWWRLREFLDEAKELPAACFSCTVELRGRQDVSDELGRRDAAGLFAFLCRRGLISGAPRACRKSTLAVPLDATDVLYAPAGGLVSFTKKLGDEVKAGETVAVLIDPAAEDPRTARTEVKAGTDGLFFAQNDSHFVAAGEGIAKVAGKQVLAHRAQGNLLED